MADEGDKMISTMSNGHETGGSEFASDEQLTGIHNKTRDWLLAHGEAIFGGRPLPTELNLPGLVVDQDFFAATIPVDEVRGIAPEACETLGLGGDLDVSYFPPEISTDRQPGSSPEVSSTQYCIAKAEPSVLEYESLFINLYPGGVVKTDRISELRKEFDSMKGITTDAELLLFYRNLLAEDDSGVNRITQDEAGALQQIFNGLERRDA